MPWWAYRTWIEGLRWEQPWLPRVEMVEVKDRDTPDEGPNFENDRDAFAKMGLSVTEMG
jgi:hypothetical protein